MIKSAKISNFQSHKDTELVFHEGLNVLTGGSDQGKTAIVRALIWAIQNKPGGSSFIRHGAKEATVELLLEEGYKIIRKKSASSNTYELNDTIFTAFGVDVPEEIKKVLNMSSVNIQQQLDSIFLLSETPGAVAAHFNKVANLEVIDTSISYINSEVRSINGRIKHTTLDITGKLDELSKFEYLEHFEKDLKIIEGLENKRIKKDQAAVKLKSLLTSLTIVRTKKEKLQQDTPPEKAINTLLALYTRTREKTSQLLRLSTTTSTLKNIIPEVLRKEKLLSSEKPIKRLLKIYDKRRHQRDALDDLEKIYTIVSKKIKSRHTTSNLLLVLEKEFSENFPEVCPLCSSKILKSNGTKK